MDNASKAILIAAGTLVGVLIISLAMYYLTSFRSAYEGSMELLNSYQVSKFNSVFNKYGGAGDSIPISGADVWNILSYVREANSDVNSISDFINSTGTYTVDNYERFFYFTDNLFTINGYDEATERLIKVPKVFHYTYTYGVDGIVNSVNIVD